MLTGISGSSNASRLMANFSRNLDPQKQAAAENQFLNGFADTFFKASDENGDDLVNQSEFVAEFTNGGKSQTVSNQQAEAVFGQIADDAATTLSNSSFLESFFRLFAPPAAGSAK